MCSGGIPRVLKSGVVWGGPRYIDKEDYRIA